jgi:hypothetical protein
VHYAEVALFVPVHHRPTGPLFWRTCHFDNDIIGPGGGREDPNGGESTALPGVRFGQFSFAVVQMDRHLGILHVRGQAEPIIVSFKQSMRNRLLLPEAKIASPLVIANDVPLFDVRIHQLDRALYCVVKRCLRGRYDRAKTE